MIWFWYLPLIKYVTNNNRAAELPSFEHVKLSQNEFGLLDPRTADGVFRYWHQWHPLLAPIGTFCHLIQIDTLISEYIPDFDRPKNANQELADIKEFALK
ncbi:hypothetical protein SAMN05216387_101344 [Nitrosovibrio tenuis]|uniref:Uncharacterized protein n=2 Tax=Nitrosovibrio tenuis TaxID=1233 RepID=A0A1H7GPA4_9PROT|nr:hypothetical protein SAMN05216387_101344 [Nitrosovibrio tenuis]